LLLGTGTDLTQRERATRRAGGRNEADAWEWFTSTALEARDAELAADVRDLGRRAIEALS